MTDLFESMTEHHAEQLAADDLHRCEIEAVMRQCYPDGDKAAEYFRLVEKSRGKEAADRLRDDVRAAWKRRRIEEAGQA